MAKQTVQIRLEPSELEWLDQEAYKAGGSSRGCVIRALIREKLNSRKPPDQEASCKYC